MNAVTSAPSGEAQQAREALEQHGVERIILLDSYLPKSRTEVALVGHTAITGLNSTGKTSLIRLWPLFFGSPTGRLVKQDASNQIKPFHEFYLPRQGSYIVFEFRTYAGLNLACFITHNNKADVKVVLLSGAYDDALFLDEHNAFRDKDELVTRARAQGRATAVCQAMADYRRLLFGDARRRGKTHELRAFNLFVGYPDHARRSLDGVHAILTSTLDSRIDERLLRRLLFDQALAEAGQSADTAGQINIDLEALDEWLENYRGLQQFRDVAESARGAFNQAKSHIAAGASEALIQAAAASRARRQGEARQTQAAALAGYEQERTDLESEFRVKRRTHEHERDETRQKRQNADIERKALEGHRKKLEDEGGESKARLADEYDARERELTQAASQLEIMTGKSRHIDAAIDNDIQAIRARFDDDVREIESRRERLEADLNARASNLEAQHQSQRDKLDERLAQASRQHNEALTRAASALAEIVGRQANIDADPALLERRDALRDQRDNAAEALSKAAAQTSKTREQRRQRLEEHERARRNHTECKRRISQLETEQETIAERLQREGTLLEFAREHAPNWQSTIAATLNEGTTLLYRKDLAPERANEPESSFFGLRIDTEKLAAVDVDADERRRLDEIQADLSHQQERANELDGEIRTLERALQALKKQLYEAEAEEALRQQRHQGFKEALRQAEQEVVDSRKNRRAALDAEHDKAKADETKAKEELEHGEEEARSARRELRETQAAARHALDAEAAERREQLRQQRRSTEAHRDRHINEKEALRRQMRLEHGVDADAIEQTKAHKNAAQARFDEARHAVAFKQRWESFLEEFESRMPGIVERIEDAEARSEELDRQWGEYETGYRKRYDRCQACIQEVSERLEAIDDDLRDLKEIEERPLLLGGRDPLDEQSIDAKTALPGDALKAQFDEARRHVNTTQAEMRTRLQEVGKVFRRTLSPMCRDFNEETGYADLAGSHDSQDLLIAVDSLRRFYGDPEQWQTPFTRFPPETRGEDVESAIRTWLATKLELRGFVDSLRQLKRTIGKQAREIESHYETLLEHLSAIDKVEIRAEFHLNQVAGFTAANRVTERMRAYETERFESGDDLMLPGPEVAKALEELRDYLGNRTRSQRVDLMEALDMRFRVIRDGGLDDKTSHRGQTLANAFSTGIGHMVAVTVLVGFLENQRRGLPIAIPWMLDEILSLDEINSRELLIALEKQRIFLVSTSPDIRAEIDPLFARRYALQAVSETGERLPSAIFVEIAPLAIESDPFALAEAQARRRAVTAGEEEDDSDE